MRTVLLILIACFLFLNLFFIVNRIVFKRLKKTSKFRQLWERHVCAELNWLEQEEIERDKN